MKSTRNEPTENVIVKIRRHPFSDMVAETTLSKLRNLRWNTKCNYLCMTETPKPFIHANVRCNEYKGEIEDSCKHGSCPHQIDVFLLHKDNKKDAIWTKILEIAGHEPRQTKTPEAFVWYCCRMLNDVEKHFDLYLDRQCFSKASKLLTTEQKAKLIKELNKINSQYIQPAISDLEK